MNFRPLLAVASLWAAGCDNHTGTIEPVPTNFVSLPQNWSDETRTSAWYTSFGSRLLPYDWFLALEQPDSQNLFRAPDYLQRFGLISAGPGPHNPDNLAIGLTRTPGEQGWLGLGCSACHSGQIYFQDQVIHIDGGQGTLDYQAFEASLINALSATLEQPEKFARFADAVSPAGDHPALRSQLEQQQQKLRNRQITNHTSSQYGFGRLDAFGQIFNAVAVDFIGIADNRREPDAPVSYPVLWDAPHLDLVQWNGSAPNAGPGPLIQNTTTALAVFGELNLASHGLGYDSSVEIGALGGIQDQWYALTAPRWPAPILGQPDPDKAARGQQVYQQHCLQCHALSDASDPHRKLKATLVPPAEVGTDATMADNFINARAATGPLQGKKLLFAAGPEFGAEAPTIQLVAHVALGALLKHPLSASYQGLLSEHSVDKAGLDQHPLYYKARPLSGIWASAPYLHNGSVASLQELLAPATRRTTFYTGRVEFDAEAVGLGRKILSTEQVSLLDTRLPGNSNAGHLYGTGLSHGDKLDLIEYLKTL